MEIRAPTWCAHIAFVTDAPGKNAGMIAGLLDHFLHHSLCKRDDLRICELLFGKLPQGNFRNQQDSVVIGVVKNSFVLWIVNWASERGVQQF